MRHTVLAATAWLTANSSQIRHRVAERFAADDRERGASALEYVIVAAILFPIVVAAAIWIGSVITSRSEEIQP